MVQEESQLPAFRPHLWLLWGEQTEEASRKPRDLLGHFLGLSLEGNWWGCLRWDRILSSISLFDLWTCREEKETLMSVVMEGSQRWMEMILQRPWPSDSERGDPGGTDLLFTPVIALEVVIWSPMEKRYRAAVLAVCFGWHHCTSGTLHAQSRLRSRYKARLASLCYLEK